MDIPRHFRLSCSPTAEPDAVVSAANVRFTVLTSRLIRLEHSPSGRFEDRPSQVFWFRRHPVPAFQLVRQPGRVEILTDHLRLRYETGAGEFSADTLSILFRSNGMTWRYGDQDEANLGGTARTLDMVSGSTRLDPGLMSRSGWAIVDDSQSLVFDEYGWLRPRSGDSVDLYFFGYGRDYRQCLADFCRLAGPVPLLPRWALGNWWSRYWPYSQEELAQLMEEFRAHEVPLSVCIIDMDWHIVDTGRDTSGWTGYTWNRALFPDPAGFIDWLHQQGLKTALNLHPALGVRPHEAMYPEMARRVGIDPVTEETVRFDIADPRFARAYFELLHHPQERDGVDFWWIDWQQGTESGMPDLDPLWWLNHLHHLDLGRDGQRRSFIFSRWGGLGNHRYPIGFSGDTVINWESLAFQPYFTATAANVGYGWWSHDIGGHMRGIEEPELFARWVQFGVFSPIMRLHSTQNPFHERRPWGFDAEVLQVTRDAMQWRHALIPYLYAMSWRESRDHMPPIRPMYHDYPDREEAYACPNQYTFGSELIAAPFTSPADANTRLSRQVTWLPEGDWYHFFTGEHIPGDQWVVNYGSLRDIPVFARAGAILPLGPKVGWGGLDNPEELDVHVFAGADNQFTLYEDDGETMGYRRGRFALTVFEQAWNDDRMVVTVSGVQHDVSQVPPQRLLRFHIYGVARPDEVTAEIGRINQRCDFSYDADGERVQVMPLAVAARDGLTLTLQAGDRSLLSRRDRMAKSCARMLRAFRLETSAKAAIAERLDLIRRQPAALAEFALDTTPSQVRALLEVTQSAGVHHIRDTSHPHLLLLWNHGDQPGITFRYSTLDGSAWNPAQRFLAESGRVPRFRAFTPRLAWHLNVDYFGQTTVTYRGGGNAHD